MTALPPFVAWTLLILLCFLTPPALAAKKILIYTYTQGFRHYSIPTAVSVIEHLSSTAIPPIETVHSEDPSDFESPDFLTQFDALLFISVSGKALSPTGANALREYIEAGGGFLGVHEACDALYHYSWYGRLVGAFFNYHPQITHATLNVNTSHPATAHLNATWRVYDEMYNFNSNPSLLGKQYVITADEGSYKDPVETVEQRARVQGEIHPIAWWKEGNQLDYNRHVKVGGGTDPTKKEIREGTAGTGGEGRSFYTALGHTNAMWKDEAFQQHIMGAVGWLLESPTLRSSSANASEGAVGSAFDPTAASRTMRKGATGAISGPGVSSVTVKGSPLPWSKSQISTSGTRRARGTRRSNVAAALAVSMLLAICV
ncbi:hypothetical protein PSEUBRA_001271 [Kalmanozyma brasiliensis GHG001]|uniref:ThuA-like domain-containing protein n=1 Tax=Kalmanozyma brasiliensis (strain GHG001) TaxID=1365824 RepID=V5EUA1_KALBG|nr:uncharacterized protein PSEUBRA_001271 [Kalmanozyma brasiliensis GHG001]EST08950.1 hypothetical protein PSEUBRA_001271 [Kalmanozyma brasiliensis GHG001]